MNLVTVFAPDGERFEVSTANARDLTSHVAGWSYDGNVAAATPAPAAPAPTPTAPAPIVAEPVKDNTDGSTHEGQESVPTEEGRGEAGPSEGEGEAPVPAEGEGQEVAFTTVEQFAALTEKADVQAYITAKFPDFTIDGRSNRDKLIAQAIELATA